MPLLFAPCEIGLRQVHSLTMQVSNRVQQFSVMLAAVVLGGCVVLPASRQQSAADAYPLNPAPLAELAPAVLGPFEVSVPLQNNAETKPALENLPGDSAEVAPVAQQLAEPAQGAAQLVSKVSESDGDTIDGTAGFLPPSLDRRAFDIPDQAGRDSGFIAIAYHRIDHDDSPYTVTPEDFAAQIQYLSESGFNSVTLEQLAGYYQQGKDLPDRAVLITVDDGHRTSFSQIHPVLGAYGFSAVYFPYSDFIDNGGLSTKTIRQMIREGGAEIGIHTKTHAALTVQGELETDQDYRNRVLDEIAEPAALLGAISGVQQTAIAYPYGKVNRQVERWARTVGLDFGFTVNCALNTRSTNQLRLNRCTIGRGDGVELFAAKIVNPKIALRRIASRSSAGAALEAQAQAAPEYLGSLADREYFTGVAIEPFSAYFVHPSGKQISYSANGLPAGLQIDAGSGLVTGTPIEVAAGSSVTIVAIDESGARTRSETFNITVY